MFALRYNRINSFRDFTYSQARALSKPDKVDMQIQSIRSTCSNYEVDLDNLAQKLDRINTSIKQYSSSTPGFIKFLHIFTGRFFKVRKLRRALPSLINVVNREAMDLFKIKPLDLRANTAGLAAKVQTQYPGTTSFLLTYHTIKAYHNAPPTPPSTPPSRPLMPLMPLSPVNPAISTVFKGVQAGSKGKIEVDSKWTAEQTRKWNILENVQNQFHTARGAEESGWDNTAKMVNEYILGKMNTLMTEGDVTLPRFYHATQKASWPLIVNSQINQTDAAMGHGAYVSTKDESSSRYGPNTFALTEDAVYPHQAAYYTGGQVADAMWARVASNITVSPKTVVHFVSEKASDLAQDQLDFLTKFPSFKEKGIVVLTRDASNMLNGFFTRACNGYDLPRTWTPYSGYVHADVQSTLSYAIRHPSNPRSAPPVGRGY